MLRPAPSLARAPVTADASVVGVVARPGVDGAAAPIWVALGKGVERARNLDQRPRDRRVTAVVLALVGVDVPVVPARKAAQRLVGAAMTALDRKVADVDHPAKVSEPLGEERTCRDGRPSIHFWLKFCSY